MNEGEEGPVEFFVAGGNPAELLELIEKAFHAIALPVNIPVIRKEYFAIGLGRYNRLDAILKKPVTNSVGIIAPVQSRRFEHVLRIKRLVKRLKGAAIGNIASTQDQGGAPIFVQAGRVNLGGQAPTRASQSLI